MKRILGTVLLLAALLAVVPAALAGGWATVTVDQLPAEVHAGEPFSLGFMVRQHGVTPVHNLGADYPIEPLIAATNTETGEHVEFIAKPTEELGHFAVDVTLPVAGTWEWSITPQPFGEQVLEPLSVLPASQFTLAGSLFGSDNGLPTAVALRWAGIGLVVLGLYAFFWQRRRPKPAVQAEG